MRFVTCLLLLAVASTVQAQFRLDINELAEPSQSASATQSDSDRVLKNRIRRFADVRNIENIIFNRFESGVAAKVHFEKELEAWIDRLDAAQQLTLSERSKLWLAGSHDIQHFFSETEELATMGWDDPRNLGNRIGELRQKLDKGICGKGSTLSKVASRIMRNKSGETDKHVVAEDRFEFSNKCAIKVAIAKIEEFVPLTSSQRRALMDLLEEKRPPRRGASKCNVMAAVAAINQYRLELDDVLTEEQLEALQVATRATTSELVQRVKLINPAVTR